MPGLIRDEATTERATELVPEQINELSRNVWNSAVLRAGIKLGVFPLLETQSLSASFIASFNVFEPIDTSVTFAPRSFILKTFRDCRLISSEPM